MSRDPHVASDYSHVKKLSVSVYCWTGAQNLLGNRRLQLCDQEMQRINLPRCVLSRLARCVWACTGKLLKAQKPLVRQWYPEKSRNSISNSGVNTNIMSLSLFSSHLSPENVWKWALGSGVSFVWPQLRWCWTHSDHIFHYIVYLNIQYTQQIYWYGYISQEWYCIYIPKEKDK